MAHLPVQAQVVKVGDVVKCFVKQLKPGPYTSSSKMLEMSHVCTGTRQDRPVLTMQASELCRPGGNLHLAEKAGRLRQPHAPLGAAAPERQTRRHDVDVTVPVLPVMCSRAMFRRPGLACDAKAGALRGGLNLSRLVFVLQVVHVNKHIGAFVDVGAVTSASAPTVRSVLACSVVLLLPCVPNLKLPGAGPTKRFRRLDRGRKACGSASPASLSCFAPCSFSDRAWCNLLFFRLAVFRFSGFQQS